MPQLQSQARTQDSDERQLAKRRQAIRCLRGLFKQEKDLLLVSGPRRMRPLRVPTFPWPSQEGQARWKNVRGLLPRLSRQISLAERKRMMGTGIVNDFYSGFDGHYSTTPALSRKPMSCQS